MSPSRAINYYNSGLWLFLSLPKFHLDKYSCPASLIKSRSNAIIPSYRLWFPSLISSSHPLSLPVCVLPFMLPLISLLTLTLTLSFFSRLSENFSFYHRSFTNFLLIYLRYGPSFSCRHSRSSTPARQASPLGERATTNWINGRSICHIFLPIRTWQKNFMTIHASITGYRVPSLLIDELIRRIGNSLVWTYDVWHTNLEP
jgi:hypothetical protein